jgi:meso-butanediol dehydrogenase / (S,S)-butanediol dehydrogenase / diacetyl reductase
VSKASSHERVVLITGASSGIGETAARRFAQGGYRLVLLARRRERLDALAEQLSPLTQTAICATDVTAADAPERAVALAMEKFGRLDCLVNNAGSGRWAPVHLTDDVMLNEVIEISLKAPFRFSREVLKVMRPGSSILSVGSTFGILGGLDGGIYCTVKAGLTGLTQALAVQYGADGIRANVVAPGVIKTDMTKDYWEAPAFRRLNQDMTPFNREGTMLDVANLLFFLASDEGGFINGQTIALDGGWTTTKYLTRAALLAKPEG